MSERYDPKGHYELRYNGVKCAEIIAGRYVEGRDLDLVTGEIKENVLWIGGRRIGPVEKLTITRCSDGRRFELVPVQQV